MATSGGRMTGLAYVPGFSLNNQEGTADEIYKFGIGSDLFFPGGPGDLT